MTELERFASAMLSQWEAEGGAPEAPIPVNALLDRILPYRTARRMLGIDVSEDYEALVLRLVAGQERLVVTLPPDAGEMARSTVSSKLPDLDVLQLLRAATVQLTPDALARLAGSASSPAEPEPAVVTAPPPVREVPAAMTSQPPADDHCWSCSQALPVGRNAKFCPFCGADQRQPACSACNAPVERTWKHCPDCGHRLWEARPA